TSLSLSELEAHIKNGQPLPEKSCLITFDDGYRDNYTEMYPLLKKYGLKANIFLVAGFLKPGKKDPDEYLRIEDIKLMSSEGSVEFGLHSLKHDSYNELSLEQIRDDVQACRKIFDQAGIVYQPSLAFTYGAFPKHDRLKRLSMFQLFDQLGINVAYRIGNRINQLPIGEKFLVQRLDIRGDEAFRRFKRALRTGKKLI
ncbi:MAG: polysaccharide deacetylase family protein, partial [Chitinophagaceae bacterium]